MSWIPVIAWAAALALAAVTIGFCAYELHWKTARLRADLGRLQALGTRLRALKDEAVGAQQRAARTGVR